MSNNRLILNGLQEQLVTFGRLPAALVGEAEEIVSDTADDAMSDIVGGYPDRTGDLRRKVKIEALAVGPFGAGRRVVNKSKLAIIFENGTQARHYFTMRGKVKLLGKMPPGHVFVPAMVRHRGRMNEQLAAMVERHGLEVTS